MKRLLFVSAFLSLPLFAFGGPEDYIQEKPPVKKSSMSANNFGIEAGMRSQSGEINNSTISVSSKNGFQFGATGEFYSQGPWRLRSGLLYTQRPIAVSVKDPGTGSGDVMFTYFDIPVQAMYRFEDYGAFFFGPVVSLLLDKKYNAGGNLSSATVTGAKSTVFPIQLGATFKFAPQMGATIYYESLSGDLADQISNFRAAGVNLLVTFD